MNTYFMNSAGDSTFFRCRIYRPAEETEKNYKLYVEVDERINEYETKRTTGKSILYVKKDTVRKQVFSYGDIIFICNQFTEPQSPKNPGEFNYKNYLNHLGIYHISFLSDVEVKRTDENKSKWQWEIIFSCRVYFLNLMEKYVKNQNSRTVGEALILGTKSEIDEQVYQAYANTGTMHILAVSGLHVGILFVILEFLFRPFKFFSKKRSRAALYKTIFILLIIWVYACLTGMSPSVMRSAVMFSFLSFGRLYDRHIDSFNIIFVSMIPLLIINPYQITQVGFQLSYLAVAGIVFFQPIISKLWKPSNRFLKYIWSLTSVSIAAQLATSPVSIYYFHQFPNYFLLSNILAIPVSFVVLILGVAFFIFGAIPIINESIGFLLDISLRVLNASVIAVDQLPHAVSGNLYNNLSETILMYLAICFAGGFLILKQKRYLLFMLAAILLATASISVRLFQNNRRNEITFYSTKSNTAITIKAGTSGFVLTDTDSLFVSDEFKYHLKNHFIEQGIKKPVFINYLTQLSDPDTTIFYYNFPFLFIGDHSIYFLTKSNQKVAVSNADEIDFVILTGNPYLKLDSTLQFKNACFIIDNTNKWKSCNYWIKKFDELGIKHFLLKNESLTIDY